MTLSSPDSELTFNSLALKAILCKLSVFQVVCTVCVFFSLHFDQGSMVSKIKPVRVLSEAKQCFILKSLSCVQSVQCLLTSRYPSAFFSGFLNRESSPFFPLESLLFSLSHLPNCNTDASSRTFLLHSSQTSIICFVSCTFPLFITPALQFFPPSLFYVLIRRMQPLFIPSPLFSSLPLFLLHPPICFLTF